MRMSELDTDTLSRAGGGERGREGVDARPLGSRIEGAATRRKTTRGDSAARTVAEAPTADALDAYIRSIGATPILSREETFLTVGNRPPANMR